MHSVDVVIVGAGAAGLMCAGVAGQRGLSVLLVDHSVAVAEKIRISGGGRCNFTNTDVSAQQFLSANPRFAKSALARYTPRDFVALLQRHGVPFHEKHKGQLFCDRSAQDVIDVLLAECAQGAVQRWQGCAVQDVRFLDGQAYGQQSYSYEIDCAGHGTVRAGALVVATGGLSIPKIGATDWGYRIAQQFGLPLEPTRPALVPLTFDAWAPWVPLAGLSVPVEIATGSKKEAMAFREDLLFTHRGLSGPGVLQISSYWQENTPLRINVLPDVDVASALMQAKSHSRKSIANTLAAWLPSRLADAVVAQQQQWQRPVNEASDKALAALAEHLVRWELRPTGTEGYRKAEVTAGGVATQALSSQTLQSRQPGLYFIGEVVDVTGWLGGYNFQWAWSSGYACAQGLAAQLL